ncbi:MAG: hypothetical protein JWO67_3290 [Streptosporangiaceae bacterium]|jgi:hypothetical protein|nr:hypothetical protein [Streptosporangiaceae bacterium]
MGSNVRVIRRIPSSNAGFAFTRTLWMFLRAVSWSWVQLCGSIWQMAIAIVLGATADSSHPLT